MRTRVVRGKEIDCIVQQMIDDEAAGIPIEVIINRVDARLSSFIYAFMPAPAPAPAPVPRKSTNTPATIKGTFTINGTLTVAA